MNIDVLECDPLAKPECVEVSKRDFVRFQRYVVRLQATNKHLEDELAKALRTLRELEADPCWSNWSK